MRCIGVCAESWRNHWKHRAADVSGQKPAIATYQYAIYSSALGGSGVPDRCEEWYMAGRRTPYIDFMLALCQRFIKHYYNRSVIESSLVDGMLSKNIELDKINSQQFKNYS